jgi:hypothetical protein
MPLPENTIPMDDLHRSRMCCDDFSPMLAEFIAQVCHRTDVLYEARERGFIAKLHPQTFESRHL